MQGPTLKQIFDVLFNLLKESDGGEAMLNTLRQAYEVIGLEPPRVENPEDLLPGPPKKKPEPVTLGPGTNKIKAKPGLG